MTTRTEEVITKERNPRELIRSDIITKERSVEVLVPKRERRPEVASFSAEPECKPLVAFEALPAEVALPSTWASTDC